MIVYPCASSYHRTARETNTSFRNCQRFEQLVSNHVTRLQSLSDVRCGICYLFPLPVHEYIPAINFLACIFYLNSNLNKSPLECSTTIYCEYKFLLFFFSFCSFSSANTFILPFSQRHRNLSARVVLILADSRGKVCLLVFYLLQFSTFYFDSPL